MCTWSLDSSQLAEDQNASIFCDFMSIRLRLALHGTRHRRVFHLVAIHKGQRRDGKPTETLGIYDPHMTTGQTHKTIEWSVDRIRYWLHVGAVPSKSVSKLLVMASYDHPHSRLCWLWLTGQYSEATDKCFTMLQSHPKSFNSSFICCKRRTQKTQMTLRNDTCSRSAVEPDLEKQ